MGVVAAILRADASADVTHSRGVPKRAPFPLVGSVQVYMDFDPSERFVVGRYAPTYANYLSLRSMSESQRLVW